MPRDCRYAWPAMGIVLLMSTAAAAQDTLKVQQLQPIGSGGSDARLTFEITGHDGKPWEGNPDSLSKIVYLKYSSQSDQPLKTYEAGPPALLDTKGVPIVLILAVDVSGSMGWMPADFAQRMAPLADALKAFIQSSASRPNLWMTLVPFGHEYPFPISTDGGDPAAWSGKYLRPSAPAEANALLGGVDMISDFVKQSQPRYGRTHHIVDTGLWCALDGGIRQALRLTHDNSQFALAKVVLVLLTDGKNDLRNHPDCNCAGYDLPSLQNTVGALAAKLSLPMVKVLAFGPDASVEELQQVFVDAGTQGSVQPVQTGQTSAAALEDAYRAVYTPLGNTWAVDLHLPKPGDIELPRFHLAGASDNERFIGTLFMPTPLGTMSVKGRLLAIGFGGLALVAMFSIWSFLKAGRGTESEGIPASDPGPAPPAKEESSSGGGMTWSQYVVKRDKARGGDGPKPERGGESA